MEGLTLALSRKPWNAKKEIFTTFKLGNLLINALKSNFEQKPIAERSTSGAIKQKLKIS